MNKMINLFTDLYHSVMKMRKLWRLYKKNNDLSAQYDLIQNATKEEIMNIESLVCKHNYKYRKYSNLVIIPPNKLLTLYKLSENSNLTEGNIKKYCL